MVEADYQEPNIEEIIKHIVSLYSKKNSSPPEGVYLKGYYMREIIFNRLVKRIDGIRIIVDGDDCRISEQVPSIENLVVINLDELSKES